MYEDKTKDCAQSWTFNINLGIFVCSSDVCWASQPVPSIKYAAYKIDHFIQQLKGCTEKDPKWDLMDCNILQANCFSLPPSTIKGEFDTRSIVTWGFYSLTPSVYLCWSVDNLFSGIAESFFWFSFLLLGLSIVVIVICFKIDMVILLFSFFVV